MLPENVDAAGCKLQMIARQGVHAAGRYVEGDDRYMRGRRSRRRRAHCIRRRIAGENVVERHDAVGQIAAEDADVTDGKQFDRG